MAKVAHLFENAKLYNLLNFRNVRQFSCSNFAANLK